MHQACSKWGLVFSILRGSARPHFAQVAVRGSGTSRTAFLRSYGIGDVFGGGRSIQPDKRGRYHPIANLASSELGFRGPSAGKFEGLY